MIANGSLAADLNVQNVAFNFMHRDVVLDLADVLDGRNMVCVNVGLGLGGNACGCVSWRFKMRQGELILEKLLSAVNR